MSRTFNASDIAAAVDKYLPNTASGPPMAPTNPNSVARVQSSPVVQLAPAPSNSPTLVGSVEFVKTMPPPVPNVVVQFEIKDCLRWEVVCRRASFSDDDKRLILEIVSTDYFLVRDLSGLPSVYARVGDRVVLLATRESPILVPDNDRSLLILSLDGVKTVGTGTQEKNVPKTISTDYDSPNGEELDDPPPVLSGDAGVDQLLQKLDNGNN